MSEKELASKFDSTCSMDELLQYKETLIESNNIDSDVIEELFNMILQENKSFFDRSTILRILINYICTTGNSIPFIMNLFKELLIKDGCHQEEVSYAVNVAYKQAQNARNLKMQKVILEKRRLKKEKLKREENLKKLEDSLDMSKTIVNYDTARFLIRNGFYYEEIASKSNLRIISQEDMDFILSKYRLDYVKQEETVYIKDIVGYDYNWLGGENDLLKSFSNFFDSKKNDGYHLRALSMLDLTTQDALEKLSFSFIDEPIKLADNPSGKYTINGNGMHRYCILRALYNIEMINAKNDKDKEK